LDEFEWCVSLPRIESDGPFAALPGIDQTLLVLAGMGRCVAIGGRPNTLFTTATPPTAFPTNLPTRAG
jgi:uncharacterized protein